jgi:hypothetical protein
MKIKLLIAVMIVAVVAYLNITPSEPMAGKTVTQQVTVKPTAAPPLQAPNFDTRKITTIAVKKAPVKNRALKAEVVVVDLAAKEQLLQGLIGDYNAALDDPAAKKRVVQQFKNQSEDYKKALLAKVKRGEI